MIELKLFNTEKEIIVSSCIWGELPELDHSIEVENAVIDWQELTLQLILAENSNELGNDAEKVRYLIEMEQDELRCRLFLNDKKIFSGVAYKSKEDFLFDKAEQMISIRFFGDQWEETLTSNIKVAPIENFLAECCSALNIPEISMPSYIGYAVLPHSNEYNRYDIFGSEFEINTVNLDASSLFKELMLLTNTFFIATGGTAHFISRKSVDFIDIDVSYITSRDVVLSPLEGAISNISWNLKKWSGEFTILFQTDPYFPPENFRINNIELTDFDIHNYGVTFRFDDLREIPENGTLYYDHAIGHEHNYVEASLEYTNLEFNHDIEIISPEDLSASVNQFYFSKVVKLRTYEAALDKSIKIGQCFRDNDGFEMRIIKLNRSLALMDYNTQYCKFEAIGV
jgi:hypothetical protein